MMDFIVHDRMSEFLKSVALSPPRRPGDGFDLLDVVVVDPNANDPRKMLVPMDTNLAKHFAKKKLHTRFKSSEVAPLDQKRKSEESFELTDELKTALGVEGLKASTFGKHSSTAHVNLVISNEKTLKVSGAVFSQLEKMVKENFAAIVKNAARFNIKKNRSWYDYYTGKNKVYFIVVITKLYHGSIYVEESDRKSLGAGMKTKVKGIWEAMTEGGRSESNCSISSSEGVVGVQILCFPFQKGDEDGTYLSLDPIAIKWMDENDRRRLQRVSKRHSWKVVESKGDGQMHLSNRGGFLADCKASITAHANATISFAKQGVKSHDLHKLKFLFKIFVALLLLVPISILVYHSTNSLIFPTVNLQLGPRQVDAMNQALNDFVAYFIQRVFK